MRMRNKILVFGLILLVLISSGCVEEVGLDVQSATNAPTTIAPTTTTPAIETPATTSVSEVAETPTPTTTHAPTTTTQPPTTLRTINPQSYVLILEDVGPDYRVTESKYKNLEIILDEGAEIEMFNSLKDTGFIESYDVTFTDENETLTVSNIVSRYDSKSGVEKRLDYLREYYSKKENFPNANSVSVLTGREFGDGAVYSSATYKWSIFGTDVYAKILSLNFAIENYKVNIDITDLLGKVKISDLYPYAEILEKRISSDEQIIPPTTSPPTTTPSPTETTTTTQTFNTSPTTTPAPQKEAKVEITNTYTRTDRSGYYIITGIVTNTGEVNVINTELSATAYGADGKVSGTGKADNIWGGGIKTILQVGESSPFKISVLDPISPIADYKIQSFFDTTDKTPINFEFINTNSQKTEDEFIVTGEVKNLGEEEIKDGDIRITVVLKDAQGNILDIEDARNDISMLKDGTSPFKVSFWFYQEEDVLNGVSDFDIYAYKTFYW